MENCNNRSSSVRFGFLICVITLVIGIVSPAAAENTSNPLQNVNLSPVWQWRSAYECLKLGMGAGSQVCKEKEVIKMDGVISVNGSEGVKEFCKACAEHTKEVLKCVHYAKRDFWFANKATVPYITQIISTHCNSSYNSSGFTTADYMSNAITKLPSISVVITLAFTIGSFLLALDDLIT